MDRSLRELLSSWVDADLISIEQAERIADHEQAVGGTRRRTGAAEAVGYVGAVLALSAILLLISRMWQDLVVGGRLALTLLLTVAVLGAGQLLRGTGAAAIERLVSVLWLAGVAGAGWVAWVLGDDLLGLRDEQLTLAVAVVAVVTAGALHAVRQRLLSQLAVLAGVAGMLLALLDLPTPAPGPQWWGLTLWGLGIGWALLGAGGWVRPPLVAEAAGTLLALLGAQVGSFGNVREALLAVGVVTAATVVGLAVTRDAVHLLTVGALGLFVLVPQLVFELFGDAIGAPATLLVVGLLLVLLSVGLGRIRREVEPPGTGARPPDARDRHGAGG